MLNVTWTVMADGRAVFTMPPQPMDDHCLRCGRDVQDDANPYPCRLGTDNGVEYFMCWDCGPSEWQAEIIEWEATIPEEDRLLS